MTENEALDMIRAKLKCTELDDLACIEKSCDRNCDNCDLNYEQGNHGQQKEAMAVAIKAIEEIQQYRSIGTVEECREARERQRAKKPVEYEDKYYACPICNNVLMHKWEKYPSQLKDKKCGLPYCLSCGQAISWECDAD